MMESGSGRVGARGSPMARPGRGRPGRRHVGATLAAAAMIVFAVEAHAQLRPLDPLTWSVFAEDRTLIAQVGAAVYDGQRASLAGVEGRLAELGEFSVAWRTGRVVLEAAGTILREFEDDVIFAEPTGDARPPAGQRRTDAGDYRVMTTVRLTSADAPVLAVLRFGSRLPTTDNRVGLERDQTDFFALLGARVTRGALALGVEAGVGIHGTRQQRYEQSDVLLYALAAEYRFGSLTPSIVLVGQDDARSDWAIRGNEDLRELRLGLRVGDRRWLAFTAVRGLTDFSPHAGLRVTAGLTTGGRERE